MFDILKCCQKCIFGLVKGEKFSRCLPTGELWDTISQVFGGKIQDIESVLYYYLQGSDALQKVNEANNFKEIKAEITSLKGLLLSRWVSILLLCWHCEDWGICFHNPHDCLLSGVNSLTPERFSNNFKNVIFGLIMLNSILGFRCEVILRRMWEPHLCQVKISSYNGLLLYLKCVACNEFWLCTLT